MKLREKTAKIKMTLLFALALSILMIGCGGAEPDATAENTEAGEATEAVTEKTETEEAVETEEPTETVTEEADTEEDAVIGYITTSNESINVYENASLREFGLIVGKVTNGSPVEIIGEEYNEPEGADFYEIKLESGETGYVLKDVVQLAE